MRIVHYLLAVVIVGALAGCATAEPDAGSATPPRDFHPDTRPLGRTLVYECTGIEFTARVGPGEMALWLEDRYLVLSQVRSASGTRYEEADLVFWSRGDTAILEMGGISYEDCRLNPARAPWEDARRRGVDFRAVGNEPGWYLEIRDGQNLLLVAEYGSQRLLLDAPRLIEQGDERIYSAAGDGHRVQVHIVPMFCADTMSGEVFPFSVRLEWQAGHYRGCGRELEHPWQ